MIEVPELTCTQEEADTRLLLHSKHASTNGFSQVVIRSPDTDVFIIALASSKMIDAQLLFQTGVGNKSRIIDISKVAARYGEELADALLGYHAFSGKKRNILISRSKSNLKRIFYILISNLIYFTTRKDWKLLPKFCVKGCDTVSCFSGKGKVGGHGLLEDNREDFQEAFADLGKYLYVNDELVLTLEKFVCLLYNANATRVNEARYDLFKRGKFTEDQLPPNSDALRQHIERANYQAFIWRHCIDAQPEIPCPSEHGWVIENGEIAIRWMTLPMAPKKMLEFMACACKTGCNKGRCSCKKASLRCSEMCRCVSCENKPIGSEEIIEEGYETDSYTAVESEWETSSCEEEDD